MSKGRAIVRLLGLTVWTGGWVLLWGSVTLFFLLPTPRLRVRWRQLGVQRWARGIAAVIGMRRLCQGQPPSPPFILATNHLSYLDIILLQCHVRGVFVARHDMRNWPVLGPLARVTGTIWVNRAIPRDSMRALQDIGKAIGRGDGVVLFPEGTTSSGESLIPMKATLLEWAAREPFPVHYAAITYRLRETGRSARDAVCWWGATGFGRHAWGVLQLRGFEAQVSFGSSPVEGGSRAELLDRIRKGILDLFVPISGTS